MADENRIRSGHTNKPGTHRITSMRIMDLTDGAGDVTVTLKSKLIIDQPDDQAEAKRLKNSAKVSPWTDDRLGKAFAEQSLKVRRLKDPAKELQKFADSMTRG